MAATARRRDPPDEDIQAAVAIAKQISDQAEAIYQNWKSRGLAPADLIACHAAGGDTTKLGSMLKPQQQQQQLPPSVKQKPSTPPSIELLARAPTMDNNRLEKLVKNFVVEDKAARMAAATRNTTTAVIGNRGAVAMPLPSSIQYALEKFEKKQDKNKKSNNDAGSCSITTASSIVQNPTSPPTSSTVLKPTIGQKPQISPKPPRLLLLGDTIEMILPGDSSSSVTNTTTTSCLPCSPLQTWPLKNRIISTDTVKRSTSAAAVTPSSMQKSGGSLNSYLDSTDSVAKTNCTATKPSGSLNTSGYLDEVALEEKKLLAALNEPEPSSQPQPGPVANRNEIATKWGVRSTTRRIANTTWTDQQQVVPHPELTSSQRLHILRLATTNPVRPFLTRGSVAERVLIFERCPSDLLLDKRARNTTAIATTSSSAIAGSSSGHGHDQPPKPQSLSLKQQQQSLTRPHTTLQRHLRANRHNVLIPRFHYPLGKPATAGQQDVVRQRLVTTFVTITTNGASGATRENFADIATACQLPLYWKTPLYLAACADKGSCTLEQFITFWTSMTTTHHDRAARFVYILTRGRKTFLTPEDFIPLIQDVVETHPGLTFLKEATEFHSRYVHTVIARIFYCVNRSWSGRITVPELRRSNLLDVIGMMEEEEDINQITHFFSYEHFYVIYCKFWELDRDHDLFIDKQDMTRHNDHALSKRIIDRIFSGCVTRGQRQQRKSSSVSSPQSQKSNNNNDNIIDQEEKLSYCEFVWFLLSEEDKRHATAIEYWFRCMDLDGDGFLSMYELEYFYEEQMHRMELIGIETLPFEDCLCQMLDMVKPAVTGQISLGDLKKCKMTPVFFDTFFNLEKYLDHEQRDPFASQRDHHDIDGQELSDWDRYAAEEYELLVAEEGGTDDPNSLSFDEEVNGAGLNNNVEDEGVDDDDDDPLSQRVDVALDYLHAPPLVLPALALVPTPPPLCGLFSSDEDDNDGDDSDACSL